MIRFRFINGNERYVVFNYTNDSDHIYQHHLDRKIQLLIMNLTSEQEKLAREVAVQLGELHSLSAHRKIVKNYSEEVIRKALKDALAYPEEKIYKSRGAIYTARVKEYAQHPWD
jgi:hypothetical protein